MRACLWLALFAAPAAAQPTASWNPAGATTAAEIVIASTSRKVAPTLPADARLPLPDDGLPRAPEPPRRLPDDLLPRPAVSVIQTVSAALPPAGLTVEVRAPERVQHGQPLTCQLTARNGPAPVMSARVTLPLPAGTRVASSDPPARRTDGGLVWDLGRLAGGVERTLVAELLPDVAELELRPAVAYVPASGTRVAITLPPVGLTASALDEASVGDAVTFRVTLRNNTPGPLRRVGLTCRLSDGLTHGQGAVVVNDLPGDLAPGQERTEELTVRAAAAGVRTLNVEARADGGLTAAAQAEVEVKEPVVSLQVQGPRRRARVGEEFAVRMMIANPGRSPTPGLSVFLPLPDGVELVTAGEGGAMHPAGGCVYWATEALAGEGHRAVSATLRGRSGGDWGLTAVVSGDGLRDVRSTQAVLVEYTPNLTMELSRLDDVLTLGGETTYSVRVYNQGPGPTQNVQPHFDLPENLEAVQGEGPTRWHVNGRRLAFEPLAALAERTDATFTVRVRAVRSGYGSVRTAVAAAGLTGAMTREVTARVK